MSRSFHTSKSGTFRHEEDNTYMYMQHVLYINSFMNMCAISHYDQVNVINTYLHDSMKPYCKLRADVQTHRARKIWSKPVMTTSMPVHFQSSLYAAYLSNKGLAWSVYKRVELD